MPKSNLRIICVGTGWDGTLSLWQMVQWLFHDRGNRQAMHEYGSREIYRAFCDHQETGDPAGAAELRRIVTDCDYDCIVGNGYAPILPLFAEHYGRGLKLIHLRRINRDACIASLKKSCEIFPAAYGYYSPSPEATVKRMAAFHFGEMSRAAWDRLPLEQKLGWYYDKTHSLIRAHRSLFSDWIELNTETLNDEAARRAIAQFVAGSDTVLPPPTRLNAFAPDIASYPKEYQPKLQWLLGRLNLEEVARDNVYAVGYFLEKFIAWTGYQINHAPQLDSSPPASPESIEADLARALETVKDSARQIESLQTLLRDKRRPRG